MPRDEWLAPCATGSACAAGLDRAPAAAQRDALRERGRRRSGGDDLSAAPARARCSQRRAACVARCTRTNRFSSLMPSAAHTDAGRQVLEHAQPHRVAQRRPAIARCAASARASSWRCAAISSGPGCGTRSRAPRRSPSPSSSSDSCAARRAQHVDDLVLQHGGQPGAQRRAAAEARAAGEHRLEHVVHRVFGERRVAQLAQREADEVGAVRDELGERDRHAGRARGGLHGRGAGVVRWRRRLAEAMPPLSRRGSQDARERSRQHHIAVRRALAPTRQSGHAARLDPRRRRPDRHPRAAGDEPARRRLRRDARSATASAALASQSEHASDLLSST